jgi:glycine/sarcosine N-methyltransferase
MDPKTDPRAGGELAAFYDALAPDYDSMTGFEKRFVAEKPFFRLLVERYGIRTALDAGAGTGFHSLLLAELGVAVTAADVSQKMLDRLNAHAHDRGVTVRSVQSTFRDLPGRTGGHFDAVFCLGNSLAHCLTHEELHGALHAFGSLLAPRGMMFLQILNYDRILAGRERVQSVKERDGTIFVRFYDYAVDSVQFNILALRRSGQAIQHSLTSIPLRPVRRDELVRALQDAGFPESVVYGSVSMEEFKPLQSTDCVILATR